LENQEGVGRLYYSKKNVMKTGCEVGRLMQFVWDHVTFQVLVLVALDHWVLSWQN